jgi:predicted ATPase
MTKKEIANYKERLKESDFFTSLVFIIKKYFNKTLTIEYRDGCLEFYLVDAFGNYIPFSQLSDGEQSFLSMVFIMYGYDLKHGMIFIDEPEIHFHPQMQRSFARMMEKINQNIGTQFIVSTYSPLFINEDNISSVYRFSNIN